VLAYHALVFDDVVSLAAAGSVTVITGVEFNQAIAQWDQLAVQVVADNTAGTAPTLGLQIEMSADGTHWIPKNAAPEIPPSALAPNAVTALPIGSDSGVLPNLALLRFALTFSATSAAKTHLKVYAVGREVGEGGGHTPGMRKLNVGYPVKPPTLDCKKHPNDPICVEAKQDPIDKPHGKIDSEDPDGKSASGKKKGDGYT
jgi:hypothetical protein